MSKLIKVIKLHVGSKSKVFICGYLGLSRNTVKKYIKQFNGLKVTFEELERLSDLVYELFNVQQEGELSPKILDLNRFFSRVEKELNKTGKTLKMLWEECKLKHPDGFKRIKIAGQDTPFWGGEDGCFLQSQKAGPIIPYLKTTCFFD